MIAKIFRNGGSDHDSKESIDLFVTSEELANVHNRKITHAPVLDQGFSFLYNIDVVCEKDSKADDVFKEFLFVIGETYAPSTDYLEYKSEALIPMRTHVVDSDQFAKLAYDLLNTWKKYQHCLPKQKEHWPYNRLI